MLEHSQIRIVKNLSSFFLPSNELAIGLLGASVVAAKHSDVPERVQIANTIAFFLEKAVKFNDKTTIDRVRKDVSLRLWRYLGTLSNCGAAMREDGSALEYDVSTPKGVVTVDIVVKVDELADGMRERLGLNNVEGPLPELLVSEFDVWLKKVYNGCFRAPWGTIVAVDDGIGLRGELSEQDEVGIEWEPAEVRASSDGMTDEDLIASVAKSRD